MIGRDSNLLALVDLVSAQGNLEDRSFNPLTFNLPGSVFIF